MSTNNTSFEEVLSLEEMIAKAIAGKDTSIHPDVKVESGGTLRTKGCAGYATSPWELEELIDNIWKCIIIIEHNAQKFSARSVTRLLGVDKNTIVYTEAGSVKVSKIIELVKQLDDFYKQDPIILEHIGDSISSTLLGSFSLSTYMAENGRPGFDSLDLTPNQIIYSKYGFSLFHNFLNAPLRVGLGDDEASSSEIMSLALHNALVDRGWFHHAMNRNNSYTYTRHLNNVIQQIAYSERVYSKNESMEYLFNKDRRFTFTKLIERPAGQRAYQGTSTFKYRYTKELKDILKEAVKLFLALDLEIIEEEPLDGDIIITSDMLQQINYRDLYILLNHLKGIDSNGNYIIDNSSTLRDEQESRVYSLMTTVKSETRRILGFINYDISACMQTIVAHYVEMEHYPYHQALIEDKRAFRGQIGVELDKDYDKIKEILSAADNGKKYENFCSRSETLAKYIEEAEPMVDEFIETIKDEQPSLYHTARQYAKFEYEKIWVENPDTGKHKLDLIPIDLKKFSLFFFIWTQIEREIRHAMMSCFDGFVHEVHDAVYSREEMDNEVLEKAVYDETGIIVKIEQ